MSAIHQISSGNDDVRLNVLFIHGLNGHYKDTWTSPGKDGELWPAWLVVDAPGARPATVEYDASLSKWQSGAMTIADRAANIATQMVATDKYLDVPLALIGHSLGGNVIKAIIRHLSDHQSANDKYKKLLENIRLVIFLGTPHNGSTAQRRIPRLFQKFIRYTPLVGELDAESPMLRDLGQWYRSNMPKGAKHVVLVEAKPLVGTVQIVSPSSSDPGLADVLPIPVDADHLSICKPQDRNSEVYKVVLDAVKGVLSDSLPPLFQDPASVVGAPADRTRRRRRGLESRIDSHRKSLVGAAEQRPFTILLCGPTAVEAKSSPAADVCTALNTLLLNDGFDVVLGQSQGVNNPRLGTADNTLGRELEFIGSNCNAVIVVASGASGWSELGLFGWHMANDKTTHEKGIDIVVLADETDIDSREFLTRGPIGYGEAVGRGDIVSLSTYDPDLVLQRMRARRSMYVMDRRGRPKRSAA